MYHPAYAARPTSRAINTSVRACRSARMRFSSSPASRCSSRVMRRLRATAVMIAAGRAPTMPPMFVDAESAQAAVRFATPVLVAAAGELIVERAGVVNIGIEGMMLAGALAAWVANGYGGPTSGLLAAVAAAVVLALL